MNALFGCGTSTSKSSVNQDFCVTATNAHLNFSAVIVADGIGAHFKSELASQGCALKLKELLENCVDFDSLNLERFYNEIQVSLFNYAKTTTDFDINQIDRRNSLGTTLICAIDLENEYLIAYVGNGCIWHINGDFNKFADNYYLPWNSINLLNPHSIAQDGKPALYRYLSISDAKHQPTIIRLSKSKFKPGEIIVIGTDGVYSNDAVLVGKDSEGTVWIRGEETIPLLYKKLSAFLCSDDDLSNDKLETMIHEYLADMKTEELMHDDTTIGVIISSRTLESQRRLLESEIGEQDNAKNPDQ